MLNVSIKRLEQLNEFPLLDEMGEPFEDVKLKVYPLHSKAHREADSYVSTKEDLTAIQKNTIYAAFLLGGHEGLLNDGEPVDCEDKEKLIELLQDEQHIVGQIIVYAKKKPSIKPSEPKKRKPTQKS